MRHLIKTSILLAILLGCNKLFAQNIHFPASNATWHYISIDASNPPPVTFDIYYTILGDTVVNSKNYKIISGFPGYLLREDASGKVYVRYLDPTVFSCTDTNELLAYDFSLGLNAQVYIHSCYGDSVLCKVGNIDSVLTNHGLRKELRLKIANDQLNCYTGSDTISWVEGLGQLNDLFYNLTFYEQGSVCLQEYDFVSLDSSGQSIYLLNNITNELTENINPAFQLHSNGYFTSSISFSSIKVFDILGQELWSNNTNAENYNVLLPETILGKSRILIFEIYSTHPNNHKYLYKSFN